MGPFWGICSRFIFYQTGSGYHGIKPSVKPAWKQEKERGSEVLVQLICWIALHLGRTLARSILIPIDIYYLLRLPVQRNASRQYLERLTGKKPAWLDTVKHIHCFAATILDRVFFLTGRFDQFDITIYNREVLIDRVEQGQGCILLGSHMGSFEVLRALGVEKKNLPLKIIMDKVHNTQITQVFDQLNSEISKTVMEIDGPESILQIQEVMDSGGLLGLLGDRVTTDNKTVVCHFLGEQAVLPANPYLLAHILKSPVILFFGLYRGGNRYDIHFELFAERIQLSRNERQKHLNQWAQRYSDRLAFYAQRAPFNWFNFYNFWEQKQ